MNMEEFSRENRMRCEAPNGFNYSLYGWTLSDWFTALMGEIGEAANVAKKLNRIRDGIANDESYEELQAKLASELADTYIYLDLLCQHAGINLHDAVRETFDRKSEKLGYKPE